MHVCKKYCSSSWKGKAQTQVLSVVIITGILITIIGTSYMWGVPLIEKGQSTTDNENAESFMLLLKEKIDDVAATGEQRSLDVELKGTLELLDNNAINYDIKTRGVNIATTAWVPLAGGSSPVQEDLAAVSVNNGPYLVSINGTETCQMQADCTAPENPKVILSACSPDESINSAAGLAVGGTFTLNGYTYTVHHIDCADPPEIDGQALIVGPEREKAGILGLDEAGVVIARSEVAGDKYITNYRLAYRELDDIESSNRDGYRIKLKRDGNNILSSGQHRITIKRAENPVIVGKSIYGGDLFETEVYISMS